MSNEGMNWGEGQEDLLTDIVTLHRVYWMCCCYRM